MTAWKRYSAGACCTLAILLLASCESSGGTKKKMADRGQPPASTLTTWSDSDDTQVGQPEILPDTHVSAGRLHETSGRLARAAEQYRLAIGLKPDHVEAHNRLGIVLDQLGRFKEADAAFTRAIELAPDQAHLRNNLAFSFVMQSRWADAEAQLLRALELQPEFTRARINLGMVLAQQERFDEALRQFEFGLPPADAHYNMGLMYQSKHRLTEAARAFKAALKSDPQMVAARKRLENLPPDAVSAAETEAAQTASPTPVQVGPPDTSAENPRPSAEPADEESNSRQPVSLLPVPQRLSMWIEPDLGLTEGKRKDPSAASFDCESFWMDPVSPPLEAFEPVGPPLEAFENDGETAVPVSAVVDGEAAPHPAPQWRVVALVRSLLKPLQRLLEAPAWSAHAVSHESSPLPPSAQLPAETTEAPARPTPSLTPAP